MLKSNYSQHPLEAGCDEAGRGCLAGPVFAAAVILPPAFQNPLINDSKRLSHKQRTLLREVIEKEAISFAVGVVAPEEIDRINILNASILAMHLAINNLSVAPEYLIVDGNRFKPFKNISHTCIVKGDSLYMSIAAASILAKTYRDEYMVDLSHKFPAYSWAKNKGYPTKEHRMAIEQHGVCPHHRQSFRLTNPKLAIPL